MTAQGNKRIKNGCEEATFIIIEPTADKSPVFFRISVGMPYAKQLIQAIFSASVIDSRKQGETA